MSVFFLFYSLNSQKSNYSLKYSVERKVFRGDDKFLKWHLNIANIQILRIVICEIFNSDLSRLEVGVEDNILANVIFRF